MTRGLGFSRKNSQPYSNSDLSQLYSTPVKPQPKLSHSSLEASSKKRLGKFNSVVSKSLESKFCLN